MRADRIDYPATPDRRPTGLRRSVAWAFAASMLAGAPSAMAQDVTDPALTDCTVAPSVIDATAGPGGATWTVQLTDDQSGVATAGVLFTNASFNTFVSATVDASNRTAGDALDGTYTAAIEVPEFSPAGPWAVFSLGVTDVAGNTTTLNSASLPPTCGFDVLSNPDLGAPTLIDLSVTPNAVDVTLGPGVMTLEATLEDDRSGVESAIITFESPTGDESVDVDLAPSDMYLGDSLAGWYSTTFEIPHVSENGTWTVASVKIVDEYGYTAQLAAGSPELAAAPTIDVTSDPDATPPTLVWLTATPAPVYLGSSPPKVRIEVRITDDVTGFGTAGILLESPAEGVVEGISFAASDRVGGDSLSGIYRKTVVFDTDAPTGAWVMSVSVADAAGNSAQYQQGAIPGPQQVVLVAGVPPPQPVPGLGGVGLALLTGGILYVVRRLDLSPG